MLINICGAKSTPGKKMSRNDMMNRNRSLNAARKRQMNSRG